MLNQLLQLTIDCDDKLLIIGAHGIGKSEIVSSFAKKNGFYCETVMLSHVEIADLIGMPRTITDGERAVTTWSVPLIIQRLWDAHDAGHKSILFLDELNRATEDVMNSALELVLNKRILVHQLPDDCYVVSAVNPDKGGYNVNVMDPALLDRFTVYEHEANLKVWISWALDNNIHPAIIKFLSENPDMLHVDSKDNTKAPTPRSWHKLSIMLLRAKELGYSNEVIAKVINGRVGKAVGAAFLTFFMNFTNIIEREDIYKMIKDNETGDFYADMANLEKPLHDMMYKYEALLVQKVVENVWREQIMLGDTKEDLRFLFFTFFALEPEHLQKIFFDIKETKKEDFGESGKKLFDKIVAAEPEKLLFHKVTKLLDLSISPGAKKQL